VNGDTNKHKPLSTEELFRLLETKDKHALPGTELDDFESEALEGFSKHSSVERARELTEEIHGLIHEKVNEKKTSRPVPRVIWFSAAASVLLLIILSFYFLTETTGTGAPELALNNSNSKTIPEKGTPLVPPAEESEVSVSPERAKKQVMLDELQQQTITTETKNTVSRSADVSAMNKDDASTGKLKGDAVDYDMAAASVSTGSANDATKSANKKQSEGLNDGDSEKSKFAPAPTFEDLKMSTAGNGAVVVNNTPVQQKDDKPATIVTEKPAKEQEIVYESAKASNAEAKQVAFKKRKKEAEADKMVVATGTTAQTKAKEEGKSLSASAGNSAYFAGGEEAVKTYVLDRLKKQNYKENELQGTYTVRMKIQANGTVAVITVDPEKSGYLNMTEPVKKVLNEMDGWKPAVINGSASDSEIVIHLSF
jgi:hypothetical protein